MIDISYKSNFGVKPFNVWWWQTTKLEWAPVLLEENKPYWRTQKDTSGRPWAPLSAKYRAWKTKKFGNLPILKLTGEMQRSTKIQTYLRNDKFDVITTKVGPYHQFGTRNMPARPWLGVPDRSLKKLSEIAWKNILK